MIIWITNTRVDTNWIRARARACVIWFVQIAGSKNRLIPSVPSQNQNKQQQCKKTRLVSIFVDSGYCLTCACALADNIVNNWFMCFVQHCLKFYQSPNIIKSRLPLTRCKSLSLSTTRGKNKFVPSATNKTPTLFFERYPLLLNLIMQSVMFANMYFNIFL